MLCIKNDNCETYKNPKALGFLIPVGALCGLFALFTLIMFGDQIKMIVEDTGTIDKKQVQQKIEKAKLGDNTRTIKMSDNKPWLEAIKSVMGSNPLTWGIPLNIGVDLSVENQLLNVF